MKMFASYNLKKGKKIKVNNNKGFTLVELLATIAILSIVSVIVVYTAVNLIDNAEQEGYKITINNVEKSAETYVSEYQSDMFWIDVEGSQQQYQCIIVQNLIDTGYFKADLLGSKIDDDRTVQKNDSIYILMDKTTKNISKSELVYDDARYYSLCGQSDIIGDILIEVPSGWAREKNVIITYKLSSSIGVNSGYVYNYKQDNDTSVKKGNSTFTSLKQVENVKVTKEGNLYASIIAEDGRTVVSMNKQVDGIDTEGPIIKSNYTGNKTVSGEITIPIKVTDVGSGVDARSFTLSDLNISIGGHTITDGATLVAVDTNNYNLKITNYNYDGELKIIVDKDMVFDNVGNGNSRTDLISGVSFYNYFKINYDKNGGIGSMKNTECKYGSTCTLRKNTFTKSGYVFLGWSTDKNATTVMYNDGYKFDKYPNKNDITLYAVWKANTVTIQYNVNGGSIATSYNSNGRWSSNSSGIVLNNGIAYTATINYGAELTSTGLANYNNSSYVNISKTGYVGKTGDEWKCMSGCTVSGKTYDQSKVYYASDFCNAKNGDCTVTLGVNWTASSYTVAYTLNGGTKGTNSPTSGTFDADVQISNPTKTVTVTGNANGTGATIGRATSKAQTFAGWTSSTSAGLESSAKIGTKSSPTTSWTGTATKNTYFRNLRNTSGTVTLTATWTAVAFNLPTVTKTGYTCKWNTASNGSGTSYASGALYTPSATSAASITMYAICTANTYTVNYEANIFSPLDTSRNIKGTSDNNTDRVLDIDYNHITSNLVFNSHKKNNEVLTTSRLNNLLIALNPLTFNSGDQYEIALTYVSGTISGGTVRFAVGVVENSASMTANTTLNLPTSGTVISTITVNKRFNGYLKQWMVASNPQNISFDNYTVNVVIKKKASGLTQQFIYGDSVKGRYDFPDDLSVPVKLGYEKIVSWRLRNNNQWSTTINNGDTIKIAADHVVYAKLQAKNLYIAYDGNGKDVGLTGVKTSYVYDSLDDDGVPDDVRLESYTGGDSTFAGWHFKIQPFGTSGETLWFGCLDTKIDDTVTGYEANECWGHTNPTIGWYTASEIEKKGAYYTRGVNTGEINMSNFLGFNATAVAQWK